jgi:hypothetical protein
MNKNRKIIIIMGISIAICCFLCYNNKETFIETLIIEMNETSGLPCKDHYILINSKVVFRNNNQKDIQVSIKNDKDYYRQSNKFGYNKTHKHRFSEKGKYKFYVDGKTHGKCSGYLHVG